MKVTRKISINKEERKVLDEFFNMCNKDLSEEGLLNDSGDVAVDKMQNGESQLNDLDAQQQGQQGQQG